MVRLLSQPYPTEEPTRRRLTRAALIGLFIGLFLLVFQPFGLDDWQTPARMGKMLGFGLVTFGVMIADSFLLPFLFPRYFSDLQWTVGREITRTLLLLFVIAIGNRVYLGWLLGASAVTYGWLEMIAMTFAIGIFPTVGAVLTRYIVQLRRYSQSAAQLRPYSASPAQGEPPMRDRVLGSRVADRPNLALTLVADNERDTLVILANTLLFIESSDNYCTVVYLKSSPASTSQPVKPLLRSSLSRLETQITGQINSGTGESGQPRIVRCHRSYVVNLDRVERVTGNAQGYKLHLFDGQFQVPVARRFNDSLISRLKSMS